MALYVSISFLSSMISMFFFFFKQKTAYEMRISDWSSDVCSSDLLLNNAADANAAAGSEQAVTLDGKVVDGRYVLHILDRGPGLRPDSEIGRASCRERVCQYG